jgi:hypothetical protein
MSIQSPQGDRIDTVRLGRDHYVRVATNDYSVHPKAIGRRVDVRVDLEWVTVTCGTDEVARHRRSGATIAPSPQLSMVGPAPSYARSPATLHPGGRPRSRSRCAT